MTLQVTGKGQGDKLNPVLLSKTEIQWLLGKTKVSKLFEYQLKSRIKKKVQSLMELELPLLVKTNFIDCYDDSQPGWDLDTGPLKTKSHDGKTQALVRRRSWVQIPAKACLFLENKEEMKRLIILRPTIWCKVLTAGCKVTKASLYQAELPRHNQRICWQVYVNHG